MRKTSVSIAALAAFATPMVAGVAASGDAAASATCSTTIPADRISTVVSNEAGGSDLGAGWAAKFRVNFTGLDGCDAGAKVTIALPKELSVLKPGTVVAMPSAKNDGIVGNATINADNTLTAVLTDYASTRKNVSAYVDGWATASDAFNTSEDVTLSWIVNGEVVNTTVKGHPSEGTGDPQMPDWVGKWGTAFVEDGYMQIGVLTPINRTGTPFVIDEGLTTGGQAIDCGAIDVSGDQFSKVNAQHQAADVRPVTVEKPACNTGTSTFTVNPDIGSAARVYFTVKITDKSAPSWGDTVKVSQKGKELGSASANVLNYGASGGGSGDGVPAETPKPTDPTPTEDPKTPTEEPKTPTEEPKTPTEEPTKPVPSDTPTTPAPEPTTETPKPTDPTPTEDPKTPTDEPSTPAPETPKPTDEPSTPAPETPKPTDETTTPAPTTPAPSKTTETPAPSKPSTDKPKPSTPAPSKPAESKPSTSTSTPKAPAVTPAKPATTPAASSATSTAPAAPKAETPEDGVGPKVQTDRETQDSHLAVKIAGMALFGLALGAGTVTVSRRRRNHEEI